MRLARVFRAVALVVLLAVPASAQTADVTGFWDGTLFQNGARFHLQIDLRQDADTLSGTSFISVYESGGRMSVTGTVRGRSVTLQEGAAQLVAGSRLPLNPCSKTLRLDLHPDGRLTGWWNATGCVPGTVELSRVSGDHPPLWPLAPVPAVLAAHDFFRQLPALWKGPLFCPTNRAALGIEMSFVPVDGESDIRGTYKVYGHRPIPLSVTYNADTGVMHAQLLPNEGYFDGEMDAAGRHLIGKIDDPKCTPLTFERQTPAAAARPLIERVSEILPEQHQTITISGHGFGAQPAYEGNSLFIWARDQSPDALVWNAGFGSDAVGLAVLSWSDERIVLGGFLGDYGPGYHVRPGDMLALSVWNPETHAGPARMDVRVPSYVVASDTGNVSPACKDRNLDPAARVASCSALVAAEPQSATLYRMRGIAYLAQPNFDRALADFRKALAIDSKMELAAIDIGLLYNEKREYGTAIAQGFDKALAIEPRDPEALRLRGFAYFYQKKYELAARDVDASLRLDDRSYDAQLLRGLVLTMTGRGREAILAFRRCDQIDPTPWMHDYFAGATFVSLQMYPLAHRAFSDACARDVGKTSDACKWASYEDWTLLRTAEGWADMLLRRNTGAAAIDRTFGEASEGYWTRKAH